MGISCLPDFAIYDHLASGRLISVLDDLSPSGGTFRIMWPSGKHIAPKLSVFIDFICERCFPDALK